ncbi:MAG: hypothetical protein R6V26_13980 [Roseovarius sp.]
MVEETLVGHRQVTAKARRHGICRSLLTIWHRQDRKGELGASRPVPCRSIADNGVFILNSSASGAAWERADDWERAAAPRVRARPGTTRSASGICSANLRARRRCWRRPQR